ncbi:hypothetical protein PR048_028032 [Dryococelus australis]|uniref:Uncharacterized protein n=1 Tax=Dryococelus australis TaxID=614101 RepID=A0ABQ9GI57_9NEOP|nr:hypothetical protein PR048_028032 [Dryococelus australis]
MKGRGNDRPPRKPADQRQRPERTLTCENPGVAPPGIEHGSTLTTTPIAPPPPPSSYWTKTVCITISQQQNKPAARGYNIQQGVPAKYLKMPANRRMEKEGGGGGFEPGYSATPRRVGRLVSQSGVAVRKDGRSRPADSGLLTSRVLVVSPTPHLLHQLKPAARFSSQNRKSHWLPSHESRYVLFRASAELEFSPSCWSEQAAGQRHVPCALARPLLHSLEYGVAPERMVSVKRESPDKYPTTIGIVRHDSQVRKSRRDPAENQECKGKGNGRSQRKPADQRHRPARFPHVKIRARPGPFRWEASCPTKTLHFPLYDDIRPREG